MKGKTLLLAAVEKELENHIDVKYYGMNKDVYPLQGEIVLAYPFDGMPYEFDSQFVRVVQIRLGCGQFGSDMYFLRSPAGNLFTAENQSYRAIPPHFKDAIERHFETDLYYESMGFNQGYTLAEGNHLKVGFIIDDEDTPGTPDVPFSISITSSM